MFTIDFIRPSKMQVFCKFSVETDSQVWVEEKRGQDKDKIVKKLRYFIFGLKT